MSQSVLYTLIAFFLLLGGGALFFIYRSMQQINQIKGEQLAKRKQAEENFKKRREYLIESIQVIAAAVGTDDKLSYTEACIRLSTLLQMLDENLIQKPELIVLGKVHEGTAHIPIKDEWKSLTKQERWKFQCEMNALEKEHKKDIDVAARYLKAFDFNQLLH